MDKYKKQQFSRPCVADNDHDSRGYDTKEIYFMINLAKFPESEPRPYSWAVQLKGPLPFPGKKKWSLELHFTTHSTRHTIT